MQKGKKVKKISSTKKILKKQKSNTLEQPKIKPFEKEPLPKR